MRKAVVSLLLFCIVFVQMAWLPGLRADALWNPPTLPSSRAVYLINSDTGTVLYEKNQDQKVYPASITKLMTAILTMDKYKDNLGAVITVTSQDINTLSGSDSSVLGLKAGEQITVEQLLYGLLVKSGNDCAMVLARAVGGDVDTFVKEMNQKAKQIGADNTHYVNPHGLQDPDQYTTASDVYLIAKDAMSYSELAKIVQTTDYTIPQTNMSPPREISNTNAVIKPSSQSYFYKYALGIKTGSTSEAGICLVSYAQKDGITYYAVVMDGSGTINGPNTAFADTKSLYQWAFGNFEFKSLVDTTTPQEEVNLDLAWNKNTLQLVSDKPFSALIPDSDDQDQAKIVPHPDLPKTVMAPIKKGQKIGTADIMLNNQKIGTINLVSNETVARSAPLFFVYIVGKFFQSIWFKIVSVVLVLLLVGYFTLSYLYNRRKRMINRRRSKKKYRN
jgi:D-alanyl-D-alanine carboxypeptidase (penicillin-binding protein 5/6)